jgi:pimeloyl-ACP methyl ester carboxylesterase
VNAQQTSGAEPFQPTLDDTFEFQLLARIEAARYPVQQPTDDWSLGTPVHFLRDLLAHWATRFSLTDYARRLSGLPHYRIRIDGLWTHFLHVRSPHPDATPLIITHGWPSSFLEIVPLLERLTDPDRYGQSGAIAFHVVVPSMPGFAYSDAVSTIDQLTAASIADRWRALMSGIGYESFMASGGDIGARVTAWLAVRHPDAVLGGHMSTNALSPIRTEGVHDGALTPAEEQWLRVMADWSQQEGAYHHLQSTKPLTAALAVADSPVALAAWVAEKWQAWSGIDLNHEPGRTTLLDLLTLYWDTRSFPSTVLNYYAHDLPPGPRPMLTVTSAPTSIYASEGEIGGVPPRSLADRQYHRARWSVLPRGQHFMATEEPDLLAADIQQFAADLQ